MNFIIEYLKLLLHSRKELSIKIPIVFISIIILTFSQYHIRSIYLNFNFDRLLNSSDIVQLLESENDSAGSLLKSIVNDSTIKKSIIIPSITIIWFNFLLLLLVFVYIFDNSKKKQNSKFQLSSHYYFLFITVHIILFTIKIAYLYLNMLTPLYFIPVDTLYFLISIFTFYFLIEEKNLKNLKINWKHLVLQTLFFIPILLITFIYYILPYTMWNILETFVLPQFWAIAEGYNLSLGYILNYPLIISFLISYMIVKMVASFSFYCSYFKSPFRK